MNPPTKKAMAVVFEDHMVTHEKWIKSFSWQTNLRLKLSKPSSELDGAPTAVWGPLQELKL